MLRRITLLELFIECGENQHKEMAETVGSIDIACEENRDTLIVADMNLNRLRFCDKDYPHNILRDRLLKCMARNNLNTADLGPTYHPLTHEMSSEIDHVCFQQTWKETFVALFIHQLLQIIIHRLQKKM